MKKTVRKCVCIILSLLLLLFTALPATSSYIQAQGLTTAEMAANEKIIYDYCSQVLGLNTAACVAILANVENECHFDPNNWGDNGNAYGIFQWNYRRANLFNWCSANNLNVADINAQLGFFRHELTAKDAYSGNGYYNSVYTYLKQVPNTAQGAYDAADYFAANYEQCVESQYTPRAKLARDSYWPKYSRIVDPTVTNPLPNAKLNAAAPGNLSWNAVPNAKAYRYTIRRLNESGSVAATVVNNALVSASVLSVSLLKSSNANMTEALRSNSKYDVKVVAYSDTNGTKALGQGVSLVFYTITSRVVTPNLTNPAITPTAYTSHYAGTYGGNVAANGDFNITWASTGTSYTYNVRILTQAPVPASANESGSDLYSADQTTTARSLSLSADTLSKYPGKWIRVKITAHISGQESSKPVYYYFERDVEIKGHTVSFDATGGSLDSYSKFILEDETVTMPTAKATPCYVYYVANGGRCMPEQQSFNPVNVGWTTTPYGTQVKYATGAKIAFTTNTKLYAVWKTSVKLSTVTPIRSGYTFEGWRYQTATGTELLPPGKQITLQDVSDITVTAEWKRNYNEPTLESIRLSAMPDRQFYKINEKVDLNGLQLTATYSDGSSAIITQGLIISTPVLTTTGSYVVTVDCEGHKVSFDVYVFNKTTDIIIRVGDVNFDEEITVSDARHLLRLSVGLEHSNFVVDQIGDVNGDKEITVADARLVLRASVGLENYKKWPTHELRFQ
ncbi:MAG: InlB B-repeat-containing protein [Clostridia bacterium]|nr:InlB B-repeat-containing protein [Clostridia bacterium]